MEQLTADRPTTVRERPPELAETRKAKPVKWWAGLGALFIVLQTYIYVDWIASGKAEPGPVGPDPIPEAMKVSVHAQEAISLLALAFCIYLFFVRPWRRERRLTLDGLFVIAFVLTYWQDPLYNYTQFWSTYNAEMFNLGSWATNIPGWIAPNANLYPDPLLWSGPAYIWALFGGVVVANWVMKRVKARRPQLGVPGLVLATYGFFLVTCLLAELVWLRTGVYTYAGAIPELSLFEGHYYQLPVYEIFLFATYLTAWACLRHFRDDKGRTIAERGIDEIEAPQRRKTGLRLLALTGVVNAILLVFGIIPAQFFAIQGGPWASDLDERSYLRNGICGPGTEYACSSPDVPIPRPDSAHVDPSGKLVAPEGGSE